MGKKDISEDEVLDLNKIVPSVQEGLKKSYKAKLKPVEVAFNYNSLGSHHQLEDSDFDAKPMVLLLGQYSVGKTTFIQYILGRKYPGANIGPEPTTDRFVAVHGGKDDRVIPGNAALVKSDLPFKGLNMFGNGFLDKFQVSQCDARLLEDITLIDTPGVLAGEKQRINRGYKFTEVVSWFASRCDVILLLFDAHKLDISDEFRRTMKALSGEYNKVKIVLNKADRVTNQQLMRVHGALMWSLGRVIETPEVVRVYVSSFWDEPYQIDENEHLFNMERSELIMDLHQLKKYTAIRRVNDLVRRARSVKVHMYLIGHLKSQMPKWSGKSKKQKELMENLEEEFYKVQQQYQLPVGDFPNVNEFKSWLGSGVDFTSFHKFDEKFIKMLDDVMGRDIPELLKAFPAETGMDMDDNFQELWDDEVWCITNDMKAEYFKVFQKAGPEEGRVKGSAVRPILQQTSVPADRLRNLWDLCDTGKTGGLDLEEFCVAMYLAQNYDPDMGIPDTLPIELMPPSKRTEMAKSGDQSNPF